MRRIAVWAALLLVCLTPAYAVAEAPSVRIDSGLLVGAKDGAVTAYKGVPYAAAPVGALRWSPPAPVAPWSGARDATHFGAICPQPSSPGAGALLAGNQPHSEDCLFLNVWTFDGARKAPVMVWVHGGAFRFGSGSSRLYDGAQFARDGVIMVSLNYRLGALGVFAHPALTRAAGPNAPLGNYGLMDQVAALRWVRRNIAAFGGDPNNVTVFGESAGGVSVLSLMTAPAAQGLYAKAIVESGGGWEAEKSLGEEEQAGVSLTGLAADATPEALRAVPVETLLNAPLSLAGSGPFVDGRFITTSVTRAFAEGREARVPMIIGSNSYEASLMKLFKIPASAIASRLPAAARTLYPGDDQQVADAAFTDSVMGAPARWIAAKASAQAPAWLYHFSYVAQARRGSDPGAPHGGEILFVFGGWPQMISSFATDQDRAMERLVHGCWTSFAQTGAPHCDGLDWPSYSPTSDRWMEFSQTSGAAPVSRKAQYDMLQQFVLPQTLAKSK
jgi:para-nitrobenzyl esterase